MHVSSDGVQHAYGDGGHDGVTACTRHKNKDENINSKRRKNQFSSSVCIHSLGGDEDEAALRDFVHALFAKIFCKNVQNTDLLVEGQLGLKG